MKLKALPLTIFVTAQILSHMAFGQTVSLPEGLLLKDQAYGENADLIMISPDFQKRMGSFVKSVLATPLKQQQSSQIGWLNIEKLISEVDEVNVYANTSNKAVVGSGTRLGSVNFTEQRMALINTSLLQELTRPQGQMNTIATAVGSETVIIHEFLGALGYPDDNYEISTLLFMRTFPQDYGTAVLDQTEKSLADHLSKNPRRTKNTTFSTEGGGTSTGIGGGGDPASVAMKLVALSTLAQQKNYILKHYVKDEAEYHSLIRFINTVRIEPSERHAYDSSAAVSENPVSIKDGTYLVVDTELLFKVRTSSQVTLTGIAVVQEALKLMRMAL